MDTMDCVKEYIREHKEELLAMLSELIKIPSVVAPAQGEFPFGENVQRAFVYMLNSANKDGFKTYNADNYGGHIDFAGGGSGIVGVVGHLDVVPDGSDWDFPPFGGEIEEGFVRGRGATDDKGPVVASYFAMKALKECGYEPDKTIRLILGLDEETEWRGMNYYLSLVEDRPDTGFTPDGDFPAIHGEKGIVVFDIVKKLNSFKGKGLELTSFTGGMAANAVADSARAVIYDSSGAGYDNIRGIVEEYSEKTGHSITVKGRGKSLELIAEGISAHGAKPHKGLNAISIMMELLGGVNFANEDINDFISFYNSCIGFNLYGENIGCEFSDEPSGRLIFNVGKIKLDKRTAEVTVNVRYPVTFSQEKVYEGLMSVLDKYGLGVVKGKHQKPIYFPEDQPLISTLMDIYREHTGDAGSRPLVIGGGTYARAMDNIVAFGARFPEEKELAHQKNECISVENMVRLAEIYADAIYRLSKPVQ